MPSSNSNFQYYYLFGFISAFFVQRDVYLQKHIFYNISDFESKLTKTNEEFSEGNIDNFSITCYITVKEFICCFFSTKDGPIIYYNYFKINQNFTDKRIIPFLSTTNDENSFIKCIHLKEEVGIFAYYYNESNIFYPVLSFKEYNSESNIFENYLDTSDYSSSEIKLLKDLSYHTNL